MDVVLFGSMQKMICACNTTNSILFWSVYLFSKPILTVEITKPSTFENFRFDDFQLFKKIYVKANLILFKNGSWALVVSPYEIVIGNRKTSQK